MRLVLAASLAILIVSTVCIGGTRAECCTDKAKLIFTISGGTCGQLNARLTSFGCEVTVCGDGRPIVGQYCGRGPCNMFGCDCEGGCLHGEYGQTFLARNTRFNIQLMSTEMSTSVVSYQSFLNIIESIVKS